MVIPASIANIFAYPVSRKLSVRISDYIIRVLAPRLFAIVYTYRHFHFWGYDDKKDQLPENFIIIANHQGLLDIPLFMNFLRDSPDALLPKILWAVIFLLFRKCSGLRNIVLFHVKQSQWKQCAISRILEKEL
jgi:1-acyl-sn-glycerol-3-phosphate acyltransferase